MYTVKVNEDNTVSIVAKQRIVQLSKLVDELYFIVPKLYNTYEMKNFEFWMEFQNPVSHKVNLEQLKLIDENYKNDYLQYTIDFDTNLTAEAGDVPINLKFVNVELTDEGENIQRVRNISPFAVTITAIEDWFSVPDPALDTLTKIMLTNQENVKALQDVAKGLSASKVDDLMIDNEDKRLKVSSNGVPIGDGVDLNNLGDEVAEATDAGLIKVII